ncbi:hypothetical protein KEU06_09260 [Pseudaminobacter sp. 19-2017]|uniref:Uncharacterized protein n=1 Tax=Pseudaminobacter soli (ex Zhang et al. 2022) TaxID=2831468 RepID=A0A942E5E1_9HYPH|nr:hypothetical protein [Pseudaminobacter soli]MBS3648792.1 hypothetical protein [Pseudaminobacter soli]
MTKVVDASRADCIGNVMHISGNTGFIKRARASRREDLRTFKVGTRITIAMTYRDKFGHRLAEIEKVEG